MMILADQGAACPAYHLCLQDYLQTQFSPAHLLSELGFALVFELLQIILVAWLYRRVLKPRFTNAVHADIDAKHGYIHDERNRVIVQSPTTVVLDAGTMNVSDEAYEKIRAQREKSKDE